MADNAAAKASLEDWVKRLRGLSGHIRAEAPQMLAGLITEEIDQAFAEGRSLDGYKWPPRIEDGGPAFREARGHVKVTVSGDWVIISLNGPMVFAQFGTGKMKARPLIPIGGIKAGKLGEAIRKGLVDMGADWMNRKGRHKKWGKGAKASMSTGGAK